MRLGFSYHDEGELDEAARRMAHALAAARSPHAKETQPVAHVIPPRAARYAKPAVDAR
jgi:hypothetical protein